MQEPTVAVVVDVVVCAGGVIVTVGVVVNLWVIVTRAVNAYVVVLTGLTDACPYFVVQSSAVVNE